MLQHYDLIPAPQPRAPLKDRDANSSSTPLLPANQTSDNRKRSRQSFSDRTWLGPNIIIRLCPPDQLNQTQTLEPLLILDRAQLPLAYLDPNGGVFGGHAIRLISARIPVLESANLTQRNTQHGPSVLITRFLGESLLYAVERVQDNTHAICQLGAWVKLEDLRSFRPAAIIRASEHPCHVQPDSSQRGTIASISKANNGGAHKRRKIEKSTTTEISQDASAAQEIKNHLSELPGPEIVFEIQDTINPQNEFGGPQPTPEDIYASIATQYLDFLYISKTSLAFFAKGPLSRARASILSLHDSSKSFAFLELLRSMIIDVHVMDKKYRQKLPSIIHSTVGSSPNTKATSSTEHDNTLKRGRRTKVKLSKDGLYPTEDDLARKWWFKDEDIISTALVHIDEKVLKTRLATLRHRETLLQTIIILEILAIEATTRQEVHADPVVVEMVDNIDTVEKKISTRKTKSKRKDLGTCLDLLVDRLCIWQSINISDTEDPFLDNGVEGLHLDARGLNESNSTIQLQEFCTEVVIPFFASRIPEQAYRISRKLGGPKQPSSAKRNRDKTSSSLNHATPGAAVKRKPGSETRRPLQRAATDQGTSSSKQIPNLKRLSTDSVLSEQKREMSATPLSDMAFKDPKRQLSRSNSISNSKRLSHREVNVGAALKVNEIKAKKKLKVEQELKEAIATLKKPNRTLAVKEYFDSAGTKSTLNHTLTQVQVNATPKRANKSIQLDLATPQHAKTRDIDDVPAVVPSSSLRVPSTNPRSLPMDVVPNSVRPPSRKSGEALSFLGITETPTRGPARVKKNGSDSPKKSDILFETAVGVSNDTANAASTNGVANTAIMSLDTVDTPSIYKSLGWEDELDELA